MADAAAKTPVPVNNDNEALDAFKDAKKEEQSIFTMGLDTLEMGRPDTLRYKVLSWVLNEKYDTAIEALKSFVEEDTQYPDFRERAVRYSNHCIDLVYAIKAKRNFPGINSLTRSKQQELREKFRIHLRELQGTLVRIEVIKGDLRVKDARSTIYVIRALWIAAVAVLSVAFITELIHGLAMTTKVVYGDVTNNLIDWVLNLMGL